jgi:hypothetical protein
MSSRGQESSRMKSTRRRRRSSKPKPARSTLYRFSAGVPGEDPTLATAREHYRRERERRANRQRPHDHPLEQARRAYQALLASEAQAAKGGRPRKAAAHKHSGRHDETP